ncbi:hypothetical protein HDC30_003129 [Pseudomonas sp. JAI115]|uniref:hypothetical protein n=1 Tax=Pseudomonas sp. JAI115 TaxID=2723061 RepID=UPI00161DAC02|nr:hypothetical protein [Pseudomonas sp. JAI115]MBB6155905.1 hypothetical protein [Pseudomonas sp. JAI115]
MQRLTTPVASDIRHQAIALIGAELIAYHVNRNPQQHARLLGLVLMADTLGVLSTTDRATLTAKLATLGVWNA